eukprot:5083415-Heterocapsa_arctica.AAC.1
MKALMGINSLKSAWTNKLLEEIMELGIYLENKRKTLIKSIWDASHKEINILSRKNIVGITLIITHTQAKRIMIL